jgi:HD-GYP domain-containing protein (c-di-GMP phosphodiesterase class II)
MSIRLQQLLLLLGIALLAVALSGWQSLRQIDRMADSIAESTRDQTLELNAHYMHEKVTDIGTGLQVITQLTERLLKEQQSALEQALNGSPPSPTSPVIYSSEIAGHPEAVDDQRFSRSTQNGQSEHLKLYFPQPSFRLSKNSCPATTCEQSVQLLSNAADEIRDIYQQSSGYSLWHFVGLDNGVTMVYPGHGDYPENYDPRNRAWYRTATSAGISSWLPLSIDASTGQPVLTAAAPLRTKAGKIIGATAIDLPLRKLLNFSSSSVPWLNSSRLALLRRDENESLQVIAMKEPLAVDSDWRSEQQSLPVTGLDEATLSRALTLKKGETLDLDKISIDGTIYIVVVTAVSDKGGTFLALLSPASAIEAAVSDALAVVELQRQETLQRYIIGAALLTLLVAFVALYFANRVTRPLIQMSRTAEDLARGELSSRTGLQRSDEIGQLSGSIDRMADSIERLQHEQEQAYRDMITTLTRALEKKDSYTAGHSGRVTRNALKLGKRIGLDEETMEKLRFGSITHDLGKIGIADSVLNKPAPLDEAEYQIMKQHPTFSRTIMKPLVRFQEYAEIAGAHHEHWDGGGYPDGLKGEEIHLLARIVAIADAWDAMTGDRIYRKGMSVAQAIDILDAEKDQGQFDPTLIREFIALVREEKNLS